MTHVMGDTETLGTKPGCIILSLGAVVFDPHSGELKDTFYRNIDEGSCRAAGLVDEKDTLEFWAKPENAGAREMLREDTRPLGDVLLEFNAWWKAVRGRFFWCHGATFDAPILDAAYGALLLDAPWAYWDVRCCRTVLAMSNRRPERVPRDVLHHALDDARAQARAIAASFRTGQFNPN